MPTLSAELQAEARAFAAFMRTNGVDLSDDWLNNGPAAPANLLPKGWEVRRQEAFTGRAVRLTTLGRSDLLLTKLFALGDRGTDLADCVALRPTQAELEHAFTWVAKQDAPPQWPAHVRATLDDLSERLCHGV